MPIKSKNRDGMTGLKNDPYFAPTHPIKSARAPPSLGVPHLPKKINPWARG